MNAPATEQLDQDVLLDEQHEQIDAERRAATIDRMLDAGPAPITIVSDEEFAAMRAAREVRQATKLSILAAHRSGSVGALAKAAGVNPIALRKAASNDNIRYPGIQSSAAFVSGFVPPDYHLDGVAQAGFLYAVTAGTGSGKTAFLLALTASTALGSTLCGLDVRRGRVVYFAGENPDDIRMRWLAMAHHEEFDAGELDVHFIAGTFSIPEALARIRTDVEALGGADMIVVDTSAAYFQGDDENGNSALGRHARDLRALTELPGKPVVFVACHPTKNADPLNLQPRGGGAFVAEMDGNLVLIKDKGLVKLHWQVKHRGPDFDPLYFALETVTAPRLTDSRGRPVPTVMAVGMANFTPPAGGGKASPHDDAVLASLRSATQWGGLVDLAAWRRAYYGEHTGEDRNILKARFKRGRDNLVKSGLAVLAGDHYSAPEIGTPGTPGTRTPEIPAYLDEEGKYVVGTHGTFPKESTGVPARVPGNEDEEPIAGDDGETGPDSLDARPAKDQIPAPTKKAERPAETGAER